MLFIVGTRRHQSVGDLLAGTVVIRDPVRTQPPPALWSRCRGASTASPRPSTRRDDRRPVHGGRAFLLRQRQLRPAARDAVAADLAARVATVVRHPWYRQVHPEAFLLCAIARYQRRNFPGYRPGAPPHGAAAVRRSSRPIVVVASTGDVDCYLDHAATTPMRRGGGRGDAAVPHRALRQPVRLAPLRPRRARRDVEEAREVVAAAIGCRPGEVVFTGGGTEADNTAVARRGRPAAGRAVCTATEHHAVLAAVEQREGAVVGVDRGRSRRPRRARRGARRAPAAVVSVMAVNNEVGTVTDLAAVAAVVRRHAPGAVLHTDAVQAAPWLDVAGRVAPRRRARRCRPTSSAARRASASSWSATASALRAAARRRRTGARAAQRHAQRRRHRRDGRGVAAHGARADATSARASPRCAIGSSTGSSAELARRPSRPVPRARKVAGSAHVCIDGVENEALLFLLDEAGVCATRGVVVRQRGDGAVARARRDGRAARAGAGLAAPHARPDHDGGRRRAWRRCGDRRGAPVRSARRWRRDEGARRDQRRCRLVRGRGRAARAPVTRSSA